MTDTQIPLERVVQNFSDKLVGLRLEANRLETLRNMANSIVTATSEHGNKYSKCDYYGGADFKQGYYIVEVPVSLQTINAEVEWYRTRLASDMVKVSGNLKPDGKTAVVILQVAWEWKI